MDFFAQQDRARRNTRYLVVLFALALILIAVLVNALVSAFIWVGRDYNLYVGGTGWRGYLALFTWERFAFITLLVGSTVGLVSLVRWLQLGAGGKTVAESLGGRRVSRDSASLDEQRALNIVEELSLAANMPVPPLYLLEDERGINAFAAGITPGDAVVAITRGTLTQLNREELQGVIGHEFSHILNGDMRLGIRLAALLKGITFIGDVGHFLLRTGAYGSGRRSGDRDGALSAMGLGLLVVGWLGSLTAGAIKAAISRQKEYLADASAVQFTRSHQGIADALKVIGGFLPGSLVHAARAEEMSHLFFGEVTHHIWDGFSTHPPLERRIARLDRAWDGRFIDRPEKRYGMDGATNRGAVEAGVGREALVLAAMASLQPAAGKAPAESTTGDAPDAQFIQSTASAAMARPVPEAAARLHELALEPLGAQALALGMLVARHPTYVGQAIDLLQRDGPRGVANQVRDILPQLQTLGPGERFPLAAAAIPALKSMSTPQYRQFKNTLLALVRLDRQTDLFEWCLFQLLRHYLDPEYLRVDVSRPRYGRLSRLRPQLRVVLSMLAYQGQGDSERAFAIARDALGLNGLTLLPAADCSIASFSRAVHVLADSYPLLKPRILKAMALAAADDGEVCAAERELIAAVAAVMDCPLPPDLDLLRRP